MDQLLDVLTQALVAAIAAMVPILLGFAIRYVKVKAEAVLQEIENDKPDLYYVLKEAAQLGVRSAEQLGITGAIKDKFAYAFEVAQIYLETKGVDADVDLIKSAIEAVVLAEFPHKTILPAG